jgi:quercetin dioxygenase-like cupin family protein
LFYKVFARCVIAQTVKPKRAKIQDEGLSEHTAPFEALVLVVDGEAEVEIAGKTYRVRQNETITLPANVPHAVKAATRFKMLLTMIRA